MREEVVPYEIALQLKKLGFNEACYAFYSGQKFTDDIILMPVSQKSTSNRFEVHMNSTGTLVSAPLIQQVVRWLSDTYNINVHYYIFGTLGGITFGVNCYDEDDCVEGYYNSYDEAQVACISNIITLILKSKNENSL